MAKVHRLEVKYTHVLLGKQLRSHAARQLCFLPEEVVMEQKRGFRILGGPPVVFTSEGNFATSSGKLVPNHEIRETRWCTINDRDEVPLAGPLSLHLMFSLIPIDNSDSSGSIEEEET